MAMPSPQALRHQFRDLLNRQTCYYTASTFDPMSARIAADLGFEVGILGGSVASLQVLAAPDLALITLSEFVEQATRIGRVARLPIIADADHGYGNALNVMRTVTELERAGLAALTIEDTVLPARFGQTPPELISLEEAVGKIEAALDARIDPAFAILARTNAGVLSVDDVVTRVQAYEAAGADGVCLVGIRDFKHLEAISSHLSIPLMLVAYDNPALADPTRLAANGVRVVVNGHAAYFAAIKATYDCLRDQRVAEAGDVEASELGASALSMRYSTLDENLEWARRYLAIDTP
ncbi:oxaloacetate decarboxylase [Terasakiispira papahanaumokuakeensis]|uniref:Oxaloacetate decarboxylase n=1 Tax=Terasakiispira papahanaumokuakeensis TaxID=197479 RepID=A0A1E2V6K4_9GAMM|nr:oxaloacetate decarboxylase [Terasakiispira papahanaumokuakeensis]ODC02604.1 oxaloacetate decarboxylase [Terasakiispira papahanaumokuakeensis]